ncbi:hypothetical protein ASZ90_006242 [hydrocarbon metagenome]|uniref:Uncharacterized protein n=1 Tax=hydrocarbon metagenome TaxID=938273 RepID=A0A0W8FSR6_9ZZZZ
MNTKKHGICLTCAHFSKCALKHEKRAPIGIQYCEEYQTVCLEPVVVTYEKPKKMKQPPSGILGLCSNCVHYSYCSFPKPEAGIWHCEDYQ